MINEKINNVIKEELLNGIKISGDRIKLYIFVGANRQVELCLHGYFFEYNETLVLNNLIFRCDSPGIQDIHFNIADINTFFIIGDIDKDEAGLIVELI